MALREEGYWDEHYKEELANFKNDGDEGEVWFGRGLNKKIASWIADRIRTLNLETQHVPSVVDIGCGNAFLLCTLVELSASAADRLKPHLLGLDYSGNSIQLSKDIVQTKNYDQQIQLEQCDFLQLEDIRKATSDKKFDFVIDKGTYDAICLLASSSDDNLKEARTNYVKSLASIIKRGTIFILASCNHTEVELISLLNGQCNRDSIGIDRPFKVIDRIETPRLQFGGKVGSQVCCLILKFEYATE